MPKLANSLNEKYGWDTTVLTSPPGTRELPDLAPLATADLLVLFIRFREATDEQMAQLHNYFQSGKPAIAFRTTSHGFRNHKGWFVPLFGGHYQSHPGHGEGTTVMVPGEMVDSPLLKGVKGMFHLEYGGTYNAQPLSDDAVPVLLGKTRDLPAEPVAWVVSRSVPATAGKEGSSTNQRLFYTSLGAEADFEKPSFQNLIHNTCRSFLGELKPGGTVAQEKALTPTPGRIPPTDAHVLFDGKNLNHWKHWDPGTPPRAIELDSRASTSEFGPVYKDARWKVTAGSTGARPGYGDILTKDSFGDAHYHFDFLIPKEPEHIKGRFRGNSGVFIDGKWEIQIIDSFGREELDDHLTCGAITGIAAPTANACGKPGSWQQLEVAVQHVSEDEADLSVWLNGIQIHDRVRVKDPSPYGFRNLGSRNGDEEEDNEEEEGGDKIPVPWFVSSAKEAKACDMGKDFTAILRFRTEESGPLLAKVHATEGHRENDKVLFIEDNRLHYDIGWVGTMETDEDIADGEWHTVALRSKDGFVQIFVDGEEQSTKENFTAPDNDDAVLKLAAATVDFPDHDRHWEGEIESFRFFNQVLSDQDIELTGSSEPIERVPSVFDWKATDGGPALEVVRGERARELNMGETFTCAVRFRTNRNAGGGPLFAKAPGSGIWAPNGKVLFLQGDNLVYDIGWVGAVEAEDVGVSDGEWHIAAVTHKEGRTRLWVDGKQVAENEAFGQEDARGHVFKLGACATDFPEGSQRFGGHLSHSVFYDRELDQAELAALGEGRVEEEGVLFYYENEAIEGEELNDEEDGPADPVDPDEEEREASEEEDEEEEGEEEDQETEVAIGAESAASGPLRLQADSSKVRFSNIWVRPLAEVDHASIIEAWDDQALARGEKIYKGLCFACHGNLEQKGSLPTSRPFWKEPFKNGKDPYSLYLTLKKGYNQMPPQPWLTPNQAYDVIHYIREEFVKTNNRSEYVETTNDYLATLPKGMGTEGKLTKEQIDYAKGPKYERMDFGPMLNWTFEVAPGNIAYKGIAVRLDEGPGGVSKGRHWMVYDHDTMRVAAAWSGNKFVDWKGIAFDQSHGTHTAIVGDKTLVNPVGPGWANPADGSWTDPRFLGRDGKPYGPLPRSWVQFKGQYINGNQVVIDYTVGDARILEKAGLVQADPQPVFSRTLNVGKSTKDLHLRVSPAEVAALVVGESEATVEVTDGYQILTIPAAATPLNLTVLSGKVDPQALFIASLVAGPAEDLTADLKGGPAHWPEIVTTKGTNGNDEDPFAVDEITYPDENPWHSWMRIGGFDFFPDGKRAAVATWLGDVWVVDGIDGEFGQHQWRRICTGLFQPLGVKVVDNTIYVTCRDQLAKLHDLNGDEEIDRIECFNNDHQVTEHFHEFAMGLQTDTAGNFYYAKSARHAKTALVPHHGTLLRVSPDGSRTDILATGFRAANGVCLNPDGTYIVTDQEGHWNPKNRINYVKEGGFYGNMYGYHDVTDSSDSAMEQPLCWITNAFDRSPGELLWVPEDANWGALNGKLLNLSYGTGRVFLVPHEKINGQAQGGMVSLGLDFPTGIMRGRFHPGNGQLYTSGMFAWAGSKHRDGGFYRIRATGNSPNLPIDLKARPGGIDLVFSDPLDPVSAANPDNYKIKVWGLKRTKNYGSKHYDEKPLVVAGVGLANDRKTVSLNLPDIAPTWCMEIRIGIKDATGREVKRVIHNTIHRINGDQNQTAVPLKKKR
ncbi:MAG: family 16 glycoside hydrolase [Verrucomicrobiota bacterium]